MPARMPNEKPTPKELAWLGELHSGKLLGRGAASAMPPPMRSRLLELGLVEATPDGLVITAEGRSALAQSAQQQRGITPLPNRGDDVV